MLFKPFYPASWFYILFECFIKFSSFIQAYPIYFHGILRYSFSSFNYVNSNKLPRSAHSTLCSFLYQDFLQCISQVSLSVGCHTLNAFFPHNWFLRFGSVAVPVPVPVPWPVPSPVSDPPHLSSRCLWLRLWQVFGLGYLRGICRRSKSICKHAAAKCRRWMRLRWGSPGKAVGERDGAGQGGAAGESRDSKKIL